MTRNLRMFGTHKAFVLIVLWLLTLNVGAQTYEIGLQGGISAYKGDLNPDKYFNKIHQAGGLMIRYNHNQHFSARINGTYTMLRGSDLSNNNPYIIFSPSRQYAFETQLFELSLQAEINFLPFTSGDVQTRFTPYIFGGFGGIYYSPTGYTRAHTTNWEEIDNHAHWHGGVEPDDFSKFSVINLFGFGFKVNIVEDFILGVEWGMRYAGLPGNNDRGTDYLDMVSLKGNPKNNDWYSIAGVSFTYKFLDRSKAPCPIYDF